MPQFNLSNIFSFFQFRRGRMVIVPSVNCIDTARAVERVASLRKLGISKAHLDVADGVFAPATLLMEAGSPEAVVKEAKGMALEAHLMVSSPLKEIERWAEAGVKRVFIHMETMSFREFSDAFFALKKKYPRFEIGVAILPETDAESAVPYVGLCGLALCLAVHPGFSGQVFIPGTIEKIEYLRRDLPACIITVDGGINPVLAKRAREAGANIAISGAFVWDAPDFVTAYNELINA